MYHFNHFDLEPLGPQYSEGGLELDSGYRASILEKDDGSYPGHLRKFAIIPRDKESSFFASYPVNILTTRDDILEVLPAHTRLAGEVTLDLLPEHCRIEGSFDVRDSTIRAQWLHVNNLTAQRLVLESHGKATLVNTEFNRSRVLVSADAESDIRFSSLNLSETIDSSVTFSNLTRVRLLSETYGFRLRYGTLALDPVASVI